MIMIKSTHSCFGGLHLDIIIPQHMTVNTYRIFGHIFVVIWPFNPDKKGTYLPMVIQDDRHFFSIWLIRKMWRRQSC